MPAPLPRPSPGAMRAAISAHGITRAARMLRIDARTLRKWATEADVYTVRPYRWHPRPPWWKRLAARLRR